jgi:hypothetical protein
VTEYLFSYGTLRDADVQLANFGRHLDGAPDALPGYRLEWHVITDPQVIEVSGSDRHPIISPTADSSDLVAGTVFALTPAELASADAYEVGDYERVSVTLQSGLQAWVYGPSRPTPVED